MKLIKIYGRGRLFLKLYLRSVNRNRYVQVYTVEPIEDAPFPSIETLKLYVERLRSKFPDRGFYLKERILTIDGSRKRMLQVCQRTYDKLENGRIKKKTDYLSLYFDLEDRSIYIPLSHLYSRIRLHSYLIFKALGSLGLIKPKYLKTVSIPSARISSARRYVW